MPRPARSKKAKRKKGSEVDQFEGVIARNRQAKHNYEILDTLEVGIMLQGSEIKSIRNGKVVLQDAFARVEQNKAGTAEVWLHGLDVAEYPQASMNNHLPKRPRKLLLKRREIEKFAKPAMDKSLTLVPLDMHFRRGIAKLTLAVAKGRKQHDNRERIKADIDRREMRQVFRT